MAGLVGCWVGWLDVGWAGGMSEIIDLVNNFK